MIDSTEAVSTPLGTRSGALSSSGTGGGVRAFDSDDRKPRRAGGFWPGLVIP